MARGTNAYAACAARLITALAGDRAAATEIAVTAFAHPCAVGTELVATPFAITTAIVTDVVAAVVTRGATMPAIKGHIRRAGVVSGEYAAHEQEEISDSALLKCALDRR